MTVADEVAPALALRPALAADAPGLALLHAGCFEDAWSAAAMVEVLAMPGAFGFVAGFASLPPAGLALARTNTDEAELLTLAVGTPWRRHGLARLLVRAVAAEAERRGAVRLFLEVAEDNPGARALYAGEGFAQVGRRRGYYMRRQAPAADALTLRRDLAAPRHWLSIR